MNSKQLLPGIMVYNNVFKDTKKIKDIVSSSENLENDGQYYIGNWGPWGHMGRSTALNPSVFDLTGGSCVHNGDGLDSCVNKTNWLTNTAPSNHLCEGVLEEYKRFVVDSHAIDQRYFLNEIRNAYKSVLLDYTKGLDGFDFNSAEWVTPSIHLLKHLRTPEEHSMSMPCHTDAPQFDSESGGSTFILTITMYLNDDYEGGELAFLDERNSDVVHYRPKAGDITVFPSAVPYFHGVERVESGERYVVRTFISKMLEPSKDWIENSNKHGHQRWFEMEKNRIKGEWNNPNYFKLVVYKDDPEFDKTYEGAVKIKSDMGMPFYVNKNRGYYKT